MSLNYALPHQEVEALACVLDDECPWSRVSTVLNHSGWVDVISCIKAQSPKAYRELVATYQTRIEAYYEKRGWL